MGDLADVACEEKMKVVALFNLKKRNLRRWMDVITPANHRTEAV